VASPKEEAAEWRESCTHTCACERNPLPLSRLLLLPPAGHLRRPEISRERANERARVATETFSVHLTDNATTAVYLLRPIIIPPAPSFPLPSASPAERFPRDESSPGGAGPGIPQAQSRAFAGWASLPSLPSPLSLPFVLSLSYRELAARRISEGSRDDGSIGASKSASESLVDPPDREFERTFGDFWSWLVEFPAQLASSTCATLTRKILVEVR